MPLRQRASRLHACAAEDFRETLETKLKDAVAREDYKAAAALKAQLDATPVPAAPLYASLQQRASHLASRRPAIVRERDHIKSLARDWPECATAQRALSEVWCGAEGEAARNRLLEAEGDAAKLQALMKEYPDWVEPANRLAALRIKEGDFANSANLCLKVLDQKPWHLDALSGIVICYANLGENEKANEWAKEAMPPLGCGVGIGPEREKWVARKVRDVEARLAELDEITPYWMRSAYGCHE